MTAPLNLSDAISLTEQSLAAILNCDGVSAVPGTEVHAALIKTLSTTANQLEDAAWSLELAFKVLQQEQAAFDATVGEP